MKRLIPLIIFPLMLIGISGCIDDQFDPPEIPEIPIGDTVTISELRQLCPPGLTYKFTDDVSLFATVTMDDNSGNLYKEAYVQDSAGDGVLVRLQASGGLYQGDSVRINLNGTTIQYYNKLFQIDSVHVDYNIKKLATKVNVEPKVVTLSQLREVDESENFVHNYESQLIKIENVQFVENAIDSTFAYGDLNPPEAREHTLIDKQGNVATVRTSGYAKFADEQVPDGHGSIVVVAGRHFDDVQLLIRSPEEINFDQPWWDPFDGLSLITIEDLKNKYSSGFLTIDDAEYINATVVADDESGNYYRTIVIQDETTGIELKINDSDIFDDFPVGTQLNVKVQGLVLGSYGGLIQLGGSVYQSGGYDRLGGIDPGAIYSFIKVISEDNTVEPTDIDLENMSDQDLGKLVRLNNVQFVEGDLGKPFAENSATNRTLTDCMWNTIIVRTSNYADFANENLPEGNGTLIAILSKFQDDYQLYIRGLDDVTLDGERCEVGVVDPVAFISEDFQSYSDNSEINKNGWSTKAEAGSRIWLARAHFEERYAQATAFGSDDPSLIMWLITPPINFSEITEPKFEFKSAQAFYTHDGFSLHYSTDYDGTNLAEATWLPLEANLAGADDNDHTWVNSGVVDLPVDSGVGYIAWRYEGSGTGEQTGSFRVDDVELYDAAKK